MNNSATTRRISKIALEYNGNDQGTAEMVYTHNLISKDPGLQFNEMKSVANRNLNVKNWALTGYISPEKSIGDTLSNEQFVHIALESLKKIGVTEHNQMRFDIHSSTKQKHLHFIINRVDIYGKNNIKAHRIGEKFGKALREVCAELNLKTDVEIGVEKKQQMLNDLKLALETAKSFDELTHLMHNLGYKVILSQNVKVGVSGMRIVRLEDINNSTLRQYVPGYKLSQITNKLKIKDIKLMLERNLELQKELYSSVNNNVETGNNTIKRKF